ncbi:hypothetical protein [Persicobacter diffluens]|uniref:DUF1611 domain-containing protein n=2 Tax=Persicobacter TaxID=59740 RepID=A0AAN4VVI2_9BACT|nr:DUF1611 domain-containing protein [Persicobacter diffluens]
MNPVKKSLITRHIGDYYINEGLNKEYQPEMGDVALFEVLKIGKHTALQNEYGVNESLFVGDYILATFGNRYATSQFEGYVPDQPQEVYQILGQGGVVGSLKSAHSRFSKVGSTDVRMIGYAMNPASDQVLNTRYFKSQPYLFNSRKHRSYKVILSLGSSMDSGKTTTAAYLTKGLKNMGQRIGFIKLTGTAYDKDRKLVEDAGADLALDFSHLGYPSTYMCETIEILNILETLLNQVEEVQPNTVVIEIADGLLQRETKNLINCKEFMNIVDGVMLSCYDSLAILSGVEILKSVGLPPFVLSGIFTSSPLLIEEVKEIINIPVLKLNHFLAPDKLAHILPQRISVL